MPLPNLPPILELDVSSPGVELDTDTYTVDITGDPDGPVVLAVLQEGPVGPVGPAGDGGFSYVQDAPAATWIITNTLGRYPASVLLIVDNEQRSTDLVFSGPNGYDTISVTWASPTTGRAEVI